MAIALVPMHAIPMQGQTSSDPESELRTGIDLTRQGMMTQAIPHLQAASGHVKDAYAAEFNLALCYVGTGQFEMAIGVLNSLRASAHDTPAMNNLLAQVYAGEGKQQPAMKALEAAAAQSPTDEKLYALVADACSDYKQYELGLQVVSLGLTRLPQSPRLHYERALFLAQLDRFEEAKPEFERAISLQPEGDIAYLAMVQEALYEDRIPDAVRLARQGIAAGHRDAVLLSLLGTVLLHAGAAPGQPEFAEARTALEESVSERPNYSSAQIALGSLYLLDNRLDDAVTHLEIGRRLEPRNPAVYTHLAKAYRRLGERQKAQEMLATLGQLVRQ
jgi:predicted Zn-dependent protease